MFTGVLLQTIQGIVDEINAVLFPSVGSSRQKPSSGNSKAFIWLIQQNQNSSPVIINCT